LQKNNRHRNRDYQYGLAQEKFSKADTPVAPLPQERAWWDVTHCRPIEAVFIDKQTIKGANTITYKVIDTAQKMQLDLNRPLIQ
jgi:hypothetical protein